MYLKHCKILAAFINSAFNPWVPLPNRNYWKKICPGYETFVTENEIRTAVGVPRQALSLCMFFVGFGDEWTPSGRCLSFYGSPFLKVSQAYVQKGCSAGEAVFIPPQHFCIHLILGNHELRTHLLPWMQYRQLLDEFPPLWWFMVSSGVHVPT